MKVLSFIAINRDIHKTFEEIKEYMIITKKAK